MVQIAQETLFESSEIARVEKRILLLKEHLFEIASAAIIRHSFLDKLMDKVKESPNFLTFNKKKALEQLDAFFGIRPKGVSYDIPNEEEESVSNSSNPTSMVNSIRSSSKDNQFFINDVPKVEWKHIKKGMYLIVIQKEIKETMKGDWVEHMDLVKNKIIDSFFKLINGFWKRLLVMLA